jgi:hypothetical protein
VDFGFCIKINMASITDDILQQADAKDWPVPTYDSEEIRIQVFALRYLEIHWASAEIFRSSSWETVPAGLSAQGLRDFDVAAGNHGANMFLSDHTVILHLEPPFVSMNSMAHTCFPARALSYPAGSGLPSAGKEYSAQSTCRAAPSNRARQRIRKRKPSATPAGVPRAIDSRRARTPAAGGRWGSAGR